MVLGASRSRGARRQVAIGRVGLERKRAHHQDAPLRERDLTHRGLGGKRSRRAEIVSRASGTTQTRRGPAWNHWRLGTWPRRRKRPAASITVDISDIIESTR